uniref:Uncharacterized protein n=1 Tax=Cacopsylla melanoneura TaxID=428564 RepID=A0A8D8SR12_9HEMI
MSSDRAKRIIQCLKENKKKMKIEQQRMVEPDKAVSERLAEVDKGVSERLVEVDKAVSERPSDSQLTKTGPSPLKRKWVRDSCDSMMRMKLKSVPDAAQSSDTDDSVPDDSDADPNYAQSDQSDSDFDDFTSNLKRTPKKAPRTTSMDLQLKKKGPKTPMFDERQEEQGVSTDLLKALQVTFWRI